MASVFVEPGGDASSVGWRGQGSNTRNFECLAKSRITAYAGPCGSRISDRS